MSGREPQFAGCRMCYVEVEGIEKPVLSCKTPVAEGMSVKTRSEKVLEIVKTAFDLIMSAHPVNCEGCPGKNDCMLLAIAKEMKFGLKNKKYVPMVKEIPIDASHPEIAFDASRCVLCGKCVYVCNEVEGAGILDFINRGIDTRIGAFGIKPLGATKCVACGGCVKVCPVKAFYYK